MLICRVIKLLTLLLAVTPRTVLSDSSIVDALLAKHMRIREVISESDPNLEDTNDCFALGELDIVFRTNSKGPPNVGVGLTDPRGRRIGFDPLTKESWQELPLAQGDINCDDLDGTDTCFGIVQVCGPISGVYSLEVIGRETTAYSLSIFARSREVVEEDGLRSHSSEAELNNIAVRKRSRNTVLLNYSRDPQENVTAQVQRPLHAQGTHTRSHRYTGVRTSYK